MSFKIFLSPFSLFHSFFPRNLRPHVNVVSCTVLFRVTRVSLSCHFIVSLCLPSSYQYHLTSTFALLFIPCLSYILQVLFLGITSHPLCIVVEYCEYGSLYDIVHNKKKSLSVDLHKPETLTRVLLDIAKGKE